MSWLFGQNYHPEVGGSPGELGTGRGMVVLTVPGWSTSEGVAAEIEYAKKVNMPIAYIDPYSYNNLA